MGFFFLSRRMTQIEAPIVVIGKETYLQLQTVKETARSMSRRVLQDN